MPKLLKAQIVPMQVVGESFTWLSVEPVWEGVDRPNTGGYSVGKVGPKAMGLATRLQAAIESGMIWLNPPELKTDIHGKTYVNAHIRLSMRKLNSELKKFGF